MSQRAKTWSNALRCSDCGRVIQRGIFCAKGRGCRS